MNVDAFLEGFAQCRHVRDFGQEPQLDLRIVCRDQLFARRRHEGAADLAALLCAYRDVLQVRLG